MKKFLFLLLICWTCAAPLPAQEKKASRKQQAEKIAQALYYIETRYVDSVDIDREIDVMLEALVERLDPHSVYVPREKVLSSHEQLDGSFEGIGIEYVMLSDTLTLQSVIADGPAAAAGMRAGDKIVSVEGEAVAGVGMPGDAISRRLRGPKGSRVSLSVLRGSEVLDFVVSRDKIPIESIDAAYVPETGIIYIKLSRFSQSTIDEFVEALRKLSPKKPRGIILDVRGNGGGYMHVAIALADMCLEKGQTILWMKGPGMDHAERASGHGFYKEGPLVILVDENSASASEILAGALQDWDRAVIVGRRSFGKGLVQQEYPLPDGSEMRLTVARYLTPSGRTVQSPYEPGQRAAYYRQARERYAHGESFSRDSISLPDSLRFKTLKLGRTVYGGGGIMPDVFVPYDTVGHTRFVARVLGGGLLSEYAYLYADRHRGELEAKDLDHFLKKYQPREQAIYDGLLAHCAEKGFTPASEEDMQAGSVLLKTRLKALLARSVLGSTAYWQVINAEEDPAFQQALEIVRSWTGTFPSGL